MQRLNLRGIRSSLINVLATLLASRLKQSPSEVVVAMANVAWTVTSTESCTYHYNPTLTTYEVPVHSEYESRLSAANTAGRGVQVPHDPLEEW
jgi:hypothetical protein